MTRQELSAGSVIGFFSLPSPSLAEHNPSAYNNAMAQAPAGAGSCAYCGTGIRNHVVVRLQDDRVVFIGTDCAGKIGGEVAESARRGETSERTRERASEFNKLAAERAEQRRVIEERVAANRAKFSAEIESLNSQGTDFHRSLAESLEHNGSLTWKQSNYALKAILGRRNKKNAEQFDALSDKLEGLE